MLLFLNEIFTIHLKDVIDILLVAYLIYAFYNLIKGTAAINIFIGIIAFYMIWKIVDLIGLNLLTEILGQFISVGVIALIIVFQQEIRKFLLILGSQSIIDNTKRKRFLFWKLNVKEYQIPVNVKAIANACEEMSKNFTGALIVVAGKNELKDIRITGTQLDAEINKELLTTIFFKNSPLHDGAVIIIDDKIVAAKCILPVTNRDNLPEELGLRHRAALGISENSDALIIIVSEQNGKISTVNKGILKRPLTKEQLEDELNNFLQ